MEPLSCKNLSVSSATPPPWFLQPEVMGVYLPGAGTLDSVVWPGAEIACSQGIPSDFYLPHVNVGPSVLLPQPLLVHTTPSLHPISETLALEFIWMNVALNPWLLDFHTA